jgi:hypothetical protein
VAPLVGATVSSRLLFPDLAPILCLAPQLTAKDSSGFVDLLDNNAQLRALGVQHGDMVRPAARTTRRDAHCL